MTAGPEPGTERARRSRGLQALERRLGHRFRDRDRLETALTHRSYRFETPGVGADNQRLEFLGDAALALAAAARLFQRHPEFREGRLTEARSRMIRGESLAGAARVLGLGPLLRLGRGERLAGGAERGTTLEDAMEAVMGAVFLDGGWPALRRVFDRVFPENSNGDPEEAGPAPNPKGDLQKYCQDRWKSPPVYPVLSETGPAHRRRFVVEARAGDRALARGEGASRREAETEAARHAMDILSGAGSGTESAGGENREP